MGNKGVFIEKISIFYLANHIKLATIYGDTNQIATLPTFYYLKHCILDSGGSKGTIFTQNWLHCVIDELQ